MLLQVSLKDIATTRSIGMNATEVGAKLEEYAHTHIPSCVASTTYMTLMLMYGFVS